MISAALTRYLHNAISALAFELVAASHTTLLSARRFCCVFDTDRDCRLAHREANTNQPRRNISERPGGGRGAPLALRTLTRWSARSRTAPPCRSQRPGPPLWSGKTPAIPAMSSCALLWKKATETILPSDKTDHTEHRIKKY